MSAVTLRPAVPDDAAALAPLAARTFRDGWESVVGTAVADAYVAEAFTPGGLEAEIADAANHVVVAEEADGSGALVGYAKLSANAKAAPECVAGPEPVLLQRLYVAADQRGRGVADALLAHAAAEALRRGRRTLWLEVDPRNARAWRFYARRGFADVGGVTYRLAGGAVNDRVRVLVKGAAPAFRPGVPEDAARLAPMAARVFEETFGADGDPGRMAAYLADAFHPDRVAAELADAQARFVLAEWGGDVVGYAKLALRSDEEPDCLAGRPAPVAELERLYVRHAWHGTGVADALMSAALREAGAAGVRTLWLGVAPTNPRARRFYARWGFADAGEHVFHLGGEDETDAVMARDLVEAARTGRKDWRE